MIESSVVESKNLGTFYKYINKRMNHRNSIAALTNKTGCLIVTDSDKVNTFNQYFSSVAVIDNGVVPTRVNTANVCSELVSRLPRLLFIKQLTN